jgi:hypothetical protein
LVSIRFHKIFFVGEYQLGSSTAQAEEWCKLYYRPIPGTGSSVSDPHWLYADPDPAFKMNADPDPGYTGTLKTKILSKSKNNVKF